MVRATIMAYQPDDPHPHQQPTEENTRKSTLPHLLPASERIFTDRLDGAGFIYDRSGIDVRGAGGV